MANVRVTLKLNGLNELMRSKPVQDMLNERANRIARAAGGNFEAVARPHKWTARAYVQPTGIEGMREEARDKRLTGAIDAAR